MTTTNLDNLLQSIQAEFRRNQIESPLLLKKVERALTDIDAELSTAFASRLAHHPAINAIGGYGNSMSAAAAHICTSQLISAYQSIRAAAECVGVAVLLWRDPAQSTVWLFRPSAARARDDVSARKARRSAGADLAFSRGMNSLPEQLAHAKVELELAYEVAIDRGAHFNLPAALLSLEPLDHPRLNADVLVYFSRNPEDLASAAECFRRLADAGNAVSAFVHANSPVAPNSA